MASLFPKTKVPKVTPPRGGKKGAFPKSTGPRVLNPVKNRIYRKDVLQQDPAMFGNFGFGSELLNETPSILGMAQPPKK
jgi:hypothetical protein